MNKQLVGNIQSQTKRFPSIFSFAKFIFLRLISQLKELEELKGELDPAEYEFFFFWPKIFKFFFKKKINIKSNES